MEKQIPQTKTQKILYTIGGILLMGGITYLLYNIVKRQPKSVYAFSKDVKDTLKAAPSELKAYTTGTYVECDFPIKKGCGGEKVKVIQSFLNKEGNYGLKVDGKFGDLTENAVIDHQMPFEAWKTMYPTAIKGQVSKDFYDIMAKNS
jgi:hypothetical protein